MSTLELHGIDGGSPLGMLAALGALRVATLTDRSARMGWHTNSLPFHPSLETTLTADAFCESVCAESRRVAETVAAYNDVIKTDPTTYRQTAESHFQKNGLPGDLTDADYFAAFACDSVTDEKDGTIKPTLLSFSNGGGMQFLLKDFRTLVQKCSTSLVASNILNGAPVLTESTGLNWDPSSLRSYALRWNDPNSDKKQTDVPLNVLAFLGLAAIPSVPAGRSLTTAGFDTDGRRWTWPIWEGEASYTVVRSLFGAMPSSGLFCRFSSRRFTDNKRLYFAPATQN
jgi:hypothetical protein